MNHELDTQLPKSHNVSHEDHFHSRPPLKDAGIENYGAHIFRLLLFRSVGEGDRLEIGDRSLIYLVRLGIVHEAEV